MHLLTAAVLFQAAVFLKNLSLKIFQVASISTIPKIKFDALRALRNIESMFFSSTVGQSSAG